MQGKDKADSGSIGAEIGLNIARPVSTKIIARCILRRRTRFLRKTENSSPDSNIIHASESDGTDVTRTTGTAGV